MEKEQNVELLLAPTSFQELLRVYASEIVKDASVIKHSELKVYSAHLDIQIQNVCIRMRAYKISKNDFETAIKIGFRNM